MSVKVDNDKVFRILFRYAHEGTEKCFTCNFRGSLDDGSLELGHYLESHHSSVAWHYNNSRPQCIKCNRYYNGQTEIFRKNLIDEVGIKAVEELEFLAKQSKGSSYNREKSYKMAQIREKHKKSDISIEELVEELKN